MGNYYKGVKDCSASRHQPLKVIHYGSNPIGLNSCLFGPPPIDPKTLLSGYENPGWLHSWYRKDDKFSLDDNAFARNVDYHNKDSYYLCVFPQKLSIYERAKNGQYVLDNNGRRKTRTDLAEENVYGMPVKIGYEDYTTGYSMMKEFIAKEENSLFWFNGGKYYKHSGTLVSDKRPIATMRPGNQETFGESAKLGSRPISPYMTEAAIIYNFMFGNEAVYLWDSRPYALAIGQQPPPSTYDKREYFGELEFYVKGLHRLSQFNSLFDGDYSFIRPVRCEDSYNRDHPVIRGIVNGRYLLLAMTNPALDLKEKQTVEVWYQAGPKSRSKVWSDTVTLQSRKVHLFQCKLPALAKGKEYDPDNFRFRYTCEDGKFVKTFTVSGNYMVPCSE